MKRYLSYILFLLLPLLVACEREIPYEGEYQDGKLVVQTLVCAGEDSLTCFITRSYFFLDKKPSKPEVLDHLSITIHGSSGPYTILKDSTVGCYHHLRLSRPIQAGDTLQFMVSHPQFGTAEATEVLLPDFVPTVQSYEVVQTPTSTSTKHLVTLLLPDYVSKKTAVIVRARAHYTLESHNAIRDKNQPEQPIVGWDTVTYRRVNIELSSLDSIFANMGNYYNTNNGEYRADILDPDKRLIMPSNYSLGKQVTFIMNMPHDITREDYTANVTLDSLIFSFETKGDTYLLYRSSMQAYLGLTDEYFDDYDLGAEMSALIGIEEPASIYSNVENGYGILMSKTRTKIRVK